jgi:flagellar hook assembly protein FlgD
LHGLHAGSYRWSVRAKDSAFNAGAVAQGTFSVGVVDVLGPQGAGRAFDVSAAYPNPFHPATSFTLSVDRTQNVVLGVYDVQGRRVTTLHEGPLTPGLHAFTLDGTHLASGTYFIRAAGAGKAAVRRVTLLR